MSIASGSSGSVDGLGRVFGSVSLAHQTCLALELVLLDTLHDIKPMASHTHSHIPSASDGDNPQALVIASLRSQVADLLTQVTQLNSKLVQSYDRISDLEDNIHLASSAQRNATLKISQLELERTQHLSALNTGLLVERTHVTAELTRLMERATDEAARRGQAESARHEIEKDLDDLSAELFGRANTMVAEARLAQAKSERRVQDAEAMLRGTEEAVASMQAQMQALREDKERTDRAFGKGKWVEREGPPQLRLLSTHVPYQEFLLFVAHLRQLRPAAPTPPPMASLLPLPFLARLLAEDSDPTLRLDAAPSLNWLTRRSVTAAIHQSQLTVEPLPPTALLDLTSPACALCGKHVLSSSHPANSNSTSNSISTSTPYSPTTQSWRPAFFSKGSTGTPYTTPTKQPTAPLAIHSPTPSVATSASFYPPSSTPPPTPPLPSPSLPPSVYIFRLLPAPSSSTQYPAQSQNQNQGQQIYPLCASGWCLARLRTTCELWRFVRTGIVERVWEEEVPSFSLPPAHIANGGGKPPVPPRRRLPSGVGKLLGMASSALAGVAPTKGSGSGSGSVTPTKGGVPPPLPRRSEVRRRDTEKGIETGGADTHTHTHTDTPAKEAAHTAEKTRENGKVDTPASTPAPSPRLDTDLEKVDEKVAEHPPPATIPLPDSPAVTTLELRAAEPDADVGVEAKAAAEGGEAHATAETETEPEAKAETDPETEMKVETSVAGQSDANADVETQAKDEDAQGGDAAQTATATPTPATPTTPIPEPTSAPSSAPALAPTSRTASPAPVPPASPAPPPLPRRAARRAVPTPAPSGDGSVASHNPGAGAGAEASSSAEEKTEGVDGKTEGVGADEKAEGAEHIPGPLTAEPESMLPAPAPAPTPATDTTTTSTAIANPPPPPVHPSRAPAPPPPPRRVPPPPAPPLEDQRRASEVSIYSTANGLVSAAGVNRSTDAVNGSANPVDEGQYVGDATWEERTWTVLVRMREDMFYARLGSVR